MRFTGGFVKIPRDIMPGGSDPLADPKQRMARGFFIDLVTMANRFDSQVLKGDKLMKVERGQILTSLRELAELSGLSFQSTRTVLRRLKNMQKINTESNTSVNTGYTLITVLDFDYFTADVREPNTEANTPPTRLQQRIGEQENLERKQEETTSLCPPAADAGAAPALVLGTEPLPAQTKTDAFMGIWNFHCGDKLKPVMKLAGKRLAKVQARLKQEPDLGYWRDVVVRLAASSFATGASDSGWVATFDWLVKNGENHLKVSEGNYDDRDNVAGPGGLTASQQLERLMNPVDKQPAPVTVLADHRRA